MAGLETLTESMGKLLNVAPQAYDDLIKPSAQAAGQALALPIKTVNALLIPLRQWIANAEYKLDETNKLIANKLKYIDENKFVAPPDFVAVPALQGLSYSIDNENLRDMYANLLAKAMVADTCNDVHPAYVEIIKQFSPLDAKLYSYIVSTLAKNGDFHLADIEFMSNGHIVKKYVNVVEYTDEKLSNIAQSVDNFKRCSLIELSHNVICIDLDGSHETIKQWSNVQNEIVEGLDVRIGMGVAAHITELGKKFYSVCCTEFDEG